MYIVLHSRNCFSFRKVGIGFLSFVFHLFINVLSCSAVDFPPLQFPPSRSRLYQSFSLDKKNVKAYLRRGTAREMLGYYKEAIEGVLILYTYC
ncbi:hypothetical protein ERO13_D08G154580v2 [Gossypium hirsutum]|uniref:Uncharacterized protein n=1 Tax=Gossypium darwinii TaxID=34276 RepID=A0A5D2BQQ2_GOSDA|nr:hypothetical protein ERO13_D08G154580v2 [Gossypium hirsutum]TYG57876.1 hypothetical protein ES288_D08G177200v1 [Gossypium darwinii]